MSTDEALLTVLFALAVPIIMALVIVSMLLFHWLLQNIASLFVKGKYQK